MSDAGPQERREAAVLVAVFADDGGERRLVLVRRGARGVHGGQLAQVDPVRGAEQRLEVAPEAGAGLR